MLTAWATIRHSDGRVDMVNSGGFPILQKSATPSSVVEYQECAGCGARKAPAPPENKQIDHIGVVRVQLPPTHFNPSIFHWQGRILFASRKGWHGKLWISELDGDYRVKSSWQLDASHPKLSPGVEDPRFFVYNNQLYLAFTGYLLQSKKGFCQLYGRLSGDASTMEAIIIPTYPFAGAQEKNWQFFELDGKLHSVYSTNPFTILRHDGTQANLISQTKCHIQFSGAIIRGGAPPVRVGSEFYHWFHTMQWVDKKKQYGMGLYTFSSHWPFTIRRHVPFIILNADRPSSSGHSIVFPCGAELLNGEWVISYGHNDNECRIIKYNFDKVEELLQ